MAIKIGNTDISAFKVGSGDCKIYIGDTLLYPTTPSFDGKWLATYSDSHTESAACDSTSAITQNEMASLGFVDIQLGDCVTNIGDFAFYSHQGLSGITIPDSVTSIGQYAFQNCRGLTSVVIPDSVTSIGEGVFNNCSGLTSCTIGSGVTSIGRRAFSNCSGLTSVIIPDTVTTINYYAFENCYSLTSVTIGNSVTTIGQQAFYQCTGLTSVTVNATTPPTLGTNAFIGTNDCPIYVPSESLNDYKTASGWSSLASRIQVKP